MVTDSVEASSHVSCKSTICGLCMSRWYSSSTKCACRHWIFKTKMIISFFVALPFLKIALEFKLALGPELILELSCGWKIEITTGVRASDSPETTPGSALHRFGKARRKLARRLRGPRRLARLYSQIHNQKMNLTMQVIAAHTEGRHAHHSMKWSDQKWRVPLRFSKPSNWRTEQEMCLAHRPDFGEMQFGRSH